MDGNPDGLRILAKRSKLPVERIRYVPDAGEEIIQSIGRGILFLMAFWSGPAITAFTKLTEVITNLEANNLEIVVVDVDGSPELYHVPEFVHKLRGCGETAWIRDGKIIFTSGLGLNTQCFVPNTIALLAMP